MQEVNIYLLSDIKGPGRKSTGTYIYVIAMKNPEIKGSVKGIKTRLSVLTGSAALRYTQTVHT